MTLTTILLVALIAALGIYFLRHTVPPRTVSGPTLGATPSPSPAPSVAPTDTPSPAPFPSPTALALGDDASTRPLWLARVAAPRPGNLPYQFRIDLDIAADPDNPRRRTNRLGQIESLLRYPLQPQDASPIVAPNGDLVFRWRGPLERTALFIAPFRGGDWGTDVFEPANDAARRLAAAWDDDPEAARIEGQVVDEQTKAPIAHALVQCSEHHATWRLVRTVAADTGGRFRIPHAPDGRLLLRARAPGYAEGRRHTGMSRWQDSDDLRIALKPGGRISGRVETEAGESVPWAEVRSGGSNSPAWTDAAGAFLLDYLPEGGHDLVAWADGFAPGFALGVQVAAKAKTSGIVIVVRPGMAIEGHVVVPIDGEERPAPDAEVVAQFTFQAEDGNLGSAMTRTVRVRTDAEGAFTIGNLPEGHEIELSANWHYAKTVDSVAVSLDPAAPPAPVTLRLPAVASIAGVVRNRNDTPVADARIAARPVGHRGRDGVVRDYRDPALSDAQGRFRIEALPAESRFHIEAEADGYQPARAENVIPVETVEDIEIVLGVGATVSGRTVLASDDRPVGNVPLQLAGGRKPLRAHSNEEGDFEFTNVADGWYRILAADPIEIDGERSNLVVVPKAGISVRRGNDVSDLEVRVAAGRTVRGRVVAGEAREPVPEARVYVMPAAASHTITRTDAEGRFEVRDIAPVQLTLRAMKEGFAEGEKSRQTLDLAKADTEEEVVLELASGEGVLEGIVVRGEDEPVKDAWVRAEMQPDATLGRYAMRRVRTETDGKFALTGLMPGASYRARAYIGRLRADSEFVEITEENPRQFVTVRIDAGSRIAGLVRDEAGQPVEGARVTASLDAGGPTSRPRHGGRSRGRFYAQTDKDGSYEIVVQEPGSYRLQASKDDYANAESGPHAVAEDETFEAPDLVLAEGAAVKGILVDLEGEPLASVRVAGAGHQTQSSYSGTFELAGLPEAVQLDFIYTPGPDSWHFKTERFTPTYDEAVFVLPLSRRVVGRLVDAESGRPVAGCEVHIESDADKAETTGDPAAKLVRARVFQSSDKDGRLEIERVPVGAAKLSVRSDEVSPMSWPVEIKPGETDLGDIAVVMGAKLRARLVDAQGEPWWPEGRSGNVRAQAFTERSRVALYLEQPGSDGAIVMSRVPLDARSVVLESREFPDITINDLPELAPGKTADLGDIVISNGATLVGRIVNARTGEPMDLGDLRRFQVWGSLRAGKSKPLGATKLGRADDAQIGRFQIDHAALDIVEIQFQALGSVFYRMDMPAYSEDAITDLGDIPYPEGAELKGRLVVPESDGMAIGDRFGFVSGASATGAPVFSAVVNLAPDGAFQVEFLPETVSTLMVWCMGYLPASPALPARSGGVVDLGDIALTRGLTMQCRFVGEKTGMDAGAIVVVRDTAVRMAVPHYPIEFKNWIGPQVGAGYCQIGEPPPGSENMRFRQGPRALVGGLASTEVEVFVFPSAGGAAGVAEPYKQSVSYTPGEEVEIRLPGY